MGAAAICLSCAEDRRTTLYVTQRLPFAIHRYFRDDHSIRPMGRCRIIPMAATYSFDVTSNIEMPEVDNAVNQARKEIGQRFDFKGSIAAIDLDQKANTLTLTAEDNFKLESVWDVLQTRLIKRSVPVKNMKRGDIEPAAGATVRQVITLQQGIPGDAAREIVKHLKDAKLKKVQAAIQGDQVRITSASKDDLQGAMQALRARDFGVALQFGNYR